MSENIMSENIISENIISENIINENIIRNFTGVWRESNHLKRVQTIRLSPNEKKNKQSGAKHHIYADSTFITLTVISSLGGLFLTAARRMASANS